MGVTPGELRIPPRVWQTPRCVTGVGLEGIDAATDALQDLIGRGWYAAHDFIPFAPWRAAPRGAVPRKDGGPARGIVDHGAPRTPLETVPEGEEVKSVNAASKEVPRPHEDKPTLGDAAQNGAVLPTSHS